MNIEDLKHVVGAVEESKPVYMRFYGYVNEENTNRFNEEFLWIQDYVKPSKIIIGINSEGGSVLHGMGTYSIIQQCPIEVETIVEGIAASMGSVIWAAGDRSYMRDYSILMIHNPFLRSCKDSDPDSQQIVKAFQKQIETIYNRRFGLSKEVIRKIMDGEEGCDGTFFNAKDAVKAGILPAENVIKTPKQVRDKVKNQTEGVVEASVLQEIMASVNNELSSFKPLNISSSIPKQKQTNNLNKTMNDEQNFAFGSVCAQLGMDKGSEVANVVNRITALIEAEKKVESIQNSYNELRIQKEGVEAQLTNVTNELASVKDELKVYQEAEIAKRNAEIEAFIDSAIADGKIDATAKAKWMEMSMDHFETVQATLNSIPKREKISEKIANDEVNVENAKSGVSETERELASQIEAAVGKDFAFKQLD